MLSFFCFAWHAVAVPGVHEPVPLFFFFAEVDVVLLHLAHCFIKTFADHILSTCVIPHPTQLDLDLPLCLRLGVFDSNA